MVLKLIFYVSRAAVNVFKNHSVFGCKCHKCLAGVVGIRDINISFVINPCAEHITLSFAENIISHFNVFVNDVVEEFA